MADKKKPKFKLNQQFTEAVNTLANTPPISNKEIVERSKKSKKR
jgi:hypothetical protein